MEAADRLAHAVGAFKRQQHVFEIQKELWTAFREYKTVRYGQYVEK